jgi:hypothetical protein
MITVNDPAGTSSVQSASASSSPPGVANRTPTDWIVTSRPPLAGVVFALNLAPA